MITRSHILARIMKDKVQIISYDELKKGIDELLLVDKWDNYKIKSSPRKFEKRLNDLFISKLGILPYVLSIMQSEDFTFPFFRLRKETNSMNNTLISEYSYPPNKVVKSIQRANIPYHPVFYCSDNPMTAILETVRNENKINPKTNYYLSKWELKPKLEYRVTPFLFGNLSESSPFKLISDDNLRKIEEVFSDYTEVEIKSIKEIMRLLSHLFIYENSYVVSSYLAHSYLYANHNYRTDIFIYPSHQTDRKRVNFAIHPNIVTEKLKLSEVYKMNILNISEDYSKCTVNILEIGNNNDSIIFWEKFSSEKHTNEMNELVK